MSLDKLRLPTVSLPDFGKTAEAVSAGLGEAREQPAKAVAVFKWQDEKGVWHFSDNVARGQSAQKLSVDPNANLVHFAAAEDSRTKDDHHSGGGPSMAAVAPVGAVAKLIGDANNVEHLHQERAARRERALQD